MINNNPSSHYLVALIIENLKEFVSYLHMELHLQLCIHTEESHQLINFPLYIS